MKYLYISGHEYEGTPIFCVDFDTAENGRIRLKFETQEEARTAWEMIGCAHNVTCAAMYACDENYEHLYEWDGWRKAQ